MGVARQHIGRFDWLRQYRDLHDDLVYYRWRLKKLVSWSDRLHDGDLSRKANGPKIFRELEAEHRELTGIVDELTEEEKSLLDMVDSFHGIECDILKLKYIEGMTLEQVAEKLDVSVDKVRKIHAELHRRLDFLDDFNKMEFQISQRYDGITALDEKLTHGSNSRGM